MRRPYHLINLVSRMRSLLAENDIGDTFCMRSAVALAPFPCLPDILLCMEKGARFTGAACAFCICMACSAKLRGNDPYGVPWGLCIAFTLLSNISLGALVQYLSAW